MRHTGGQCYCALFSKVRIYIAHQNGERGTVAACDVHARVQYPHHTELVLTTNLVLVEDVAINTITQLLRSLAPSSHYAHYKYYHLAPRLHVQNIVRTRSV